MNCKTLRELAAEAGLTVEKYVHAYNTTQEEAERRGVKPVFAIVTGDPWNVLTDLVEVVINAPSEEGEAHQVLGEVLDALRSPKQFERGSEIVLFWPKIIWEKEES
jgi:hypothetical protein